MKNTNFSTVGKLKCQFGNIVTTSISIYLLFYCVQNKLKNYLSEKFADKINIVKFALLK